MDGRECLAVLVAVWAVAFAVWLLLRECYSKEADCLDYKNERCVVSRFADVPLDPDQSEYGTPEEFMELVCEVDENGSGLTAWEIDFIAAHIDDPPHQPTDRQWEALLKIQEERM